MPWIFQPLCYLETLAKQGRIQQEAPTTCLVCVLQAECWTLHLATLNGKSLGDFLLVY